MASGGESHGRQQQGNNNAVLVHKHVFGLKVDVHGHLNFVDEAVVAYPCGHHTVLFNTETREQHLIHGSQTAATVPGHHHSQGGSNTMGVTGGTAGSAAQTATSAAPVAHSHGFVSEGISAIRVSPNRRLIAVGERGAERGAVTIYDTQSLKRRKGINFSDLGSKDLRCLSFSADSKSLLVVGGSPDYTVVLFSIERAVKAIASIKLGASPGNNNNSNTAALEAAASHTQQQQGVGDGMSADDGTGGALGGRGAEHQATTPLLQHQQHHQQSMISQADMCPLDPNLVFVSGQGIARFLKLLEGNFRPMNIPIKHGAHAHAQHTILYTCHTWVTGDDHLAGGNGGGGGGPGNSAAGASVRVVVGTDSGELLVIENHEFKCVVPSSPVGERIYSLAGYSKGIVCGCEGGKLRIYERSEDAKEFYKCVKVFLNTANRSAIIELAVSPSEDNLALSTLNRQMYSFALSNTEILKEDSPSNFELLTGCEVHGADATTPKAMANAVVSSTICGLDACVWKPLVVSVGKDMSVRVWNYLEKTVDLVKKFTVEPHSVTMHPSGLYVAVGFTDRLRILSLLMDDMLVAHEIPVKMCRECRFSHGGHMLAVVNQTLCQLFDTYSGEMKVQLRGHQQSIQRVIWAENDRRIITVGKDGAAYLWDPRTGNRLHEFVQPRTVLTTAALHGDALSPHSRCFIYGTDMVVRCVQANGGVLMPERQVSLPTAMSSVGIAANGKVLFAGTGEMGRPSAVMTFIMKDGKFPGGSSDSSASSTGGGGGGGSGGGSGEAEGVGHASTPPLGGGDGEKKEGTNVVIKNMPPVVPSSVMESHAYSAHSTETTCMCFTHDGGYLFTAGSDGSLCMFEVREVDNRGVVRLTSKDKSGAVNSAGGSGGVGGGAGAGAGDAQAGGIEFAEEILVTKSDMLAKKKQYDSLQQKVSELKLNNEHALRQIDVKFKDRMQDISDKFKVELQSCRTKYDKLAGEKGGMESMYEDKLNMLRNTHIEEAAERDRQYTMKINVEKQRKEALIEERKAQNKQWDAMNAEIVKQHTDELNKLTEDYDVKTQAEQEEQQRLHGEREGITRKFEKLRGNIELDSDLEVDDIKVQFEQRLKAEQDLTMGLKAENIIMKKKYQVLVKEVKEQDDEIRGLGESEKQLRETLKGLEKDIHGHKKEIREREETIADKEKRIYDLKKKNQELEKFKFVLDYKIKELKRQIEPRENEIADMRTQVEEMDLELEQYHKANSALDLMIGELRLKMDGMQREINSQQGAMHTSTEYIAKFRKDLLGCKRHLNDHKGLKHAVRGLFTKYVQEMSGLDGSGGGGAGGETDIQIEYNRQREHLERNVEALKRNIKKDLDMFTNDNARLRREGVGLVEEMNNLRREAIVLRRQQKALDVKVSVGGGGSGGAMVMEVAPTPPLGQGSRTGSGSKGGRQITEMSSEYAREIEMQYGHIASLEERIGDLQSNLGLDNAALMQLASQ